MKLFSDITELVPKLHGGTWPHQVVKAQTLAGLVIGLRPKIIVEIGVFGGASLIPMAMALRETGSGVVWGIDPWENAASVEGQDGGNAEWWAKLDHVAIMHDFLSVVNDIGLGGVIETHRKRSDDVTPPPVIGIFHCDGNHGPQALRDVQRYAPNVRVGGIAILDDLDWSGGAVRQGEEHLFSLGFVMLYTLGTGACYQRIRNG